MRLQSLRPSDWQVLLIVRVLPTVPFQGYGSEGLKLISHEESVSYGDSVLQLTFDPGTAEAGLLTVECRLDHPFNVKTKGKSPNCAAYMTLCDPVRSPP